MKMITLPLVLLKNSIIHDSPRSFKIFRRHKYIKRFPIVSKGEKMKELLRKLSELMEMLKVLIENCPNKDTEPVVPPTPEPEPETPVVPPTPEPEPEIPNSEEGEKFNSADLSNLMSLWGTSDEKYDLNNDGIIDGSDLGILLLDMEKQEKPQPEKTNILLYPHNGTLMTSYCSPKGVNDPNRYACNLQREQEEKMEMIAKSKFGAEKYYIWYASWDSGHGDKIGNLSINEDAIVEDVRRYYGDKEPEGYGQLDYEGDFFRGLDFGKGTPENEEATRVMLSAIRRMKTEFPKMKWTYYGLPILKYWLPHPSPTNSYTWLNAPEEVKQAEIGHKYACYEELLKECDWLNPSFYNRYDPAAHTSDILPRETEYRKQLIRFCRMFNENLGTTKPIITMTDPWYAPGGKTEFANKIVQDDFMKNATLLPYLEEGVDGFAIWYAHTYYVGIAMPNQGRTPNADWKNAFIRNYGLDGNSVPWEFGSASEEERVLWRDKLIGLLSETVLNHMKLISSVSVSV